MTDTIIVLIYIIIGLVCIGICIQAHYFFHPNKKNISISYKKLNLFGKRPINSGYVQI